MRAKKFSGLLIAGAIALAVVLLSSVVAESDVNIGGTTLSVSSRTTAATESGADFSLSYSAHPERKTVIKVLVPEGVDGRIYEGNKVVYEDQIPFSFVAKSDIFYRVEVDCPNVKWSKKIEAKPGQIASLEVFCAKSAEQTGSKVDVQIKQEGATTTKTITITESSSASGEVKEEKVESPMNSVEFERLKDSLEAESFGDSKLATLKDAAKSHYFKSEQVAKLLDLFEFDDDKIEAALTCYPKVVDQENFYLVYSHFKFGVSKDELREKIKELESKKE